MSPTAAPAPLPFEVEGFLALSRAAQDALLLDAGYMLLRKGTAGKTQRVRGSRVWTSYPVIEAKYGARRTWYALEKTFRDVAARDRRFDELLRLDKRLERLF